MVKDKICVLVSGGLDSDVLLADLARKGHSVYPVYIRQGLAWEATELYWLRRYLKAIHHNPIQKLTVLSLPLQDVYGSHWSIGRKKVPDFDSAGEAVYLPGRNLLLVMKPAIFCASIGVRCIALAALHANPFPDATPVFLRAFSRALSLGLGKPIQVMMPYRRLSKEYVLRRGRHLPLHLSFSCLAPAGKRHCGNCNKCAERKKAFRKAGIKDKTRYAV